MNNDGIESLILKLSYINIEMIRIVRDREWDKAEMVRYEYNLYRDLLIKVGFKRNPDSEKNISHLIENYENALVESYCEENYGTSIPYKLIKIIERNKKLTQLGI